MIAILGTLGLLATSLWLAPAHSGNVMVFFDYQGITILIAIAVILGVKAATGRELQFLRIGDLRSSATPIRALGISSRDTWRRVGWTFSVIISLATLTFLVLSIWGALASPQISAWLLAFGLALPLAAFNAFTEEIVTRWSIAEGYTGNLARYAPWVSAVIFGSVHYFGIPGGPLGAIMAGFLAWLLTRSIQDTRGMGWAWFIHFLQDVIIFTITLALILSAS